MVPSAFVLGACVLAACAVGASGCVRTFIVGLYCEGGVKDTGRDRPGRHEGLGGDCLDIRADRPDADPATIGSAIWGPDYRNRLVIRSAGSGAYTLHRDGEQVGTAQRDGSWLHVLFSKVPPGSRTQVSRTYAVRSDAPGALL